MRTFNTGATRNNEEGKFDYEGFLNPLVLEVFAEYMNEHRLQKDGTIRASDNWQKGMPDDVYLKSLIRHVMDVWKKHRTGNYQIKEMLDALSAIFFNTQGMMLEYIQHNNAVDFTELLEPIPPVVREHIAELNATETAIACTCGLFPTGECDGHCKKG